METIERRIDKLDARILSIEFDLEKIKNELAHIGQSLIHIFLNDIKQEEIKHGKPRL